MYEAFRAAYTPSGVALCEPIGRALSDTQTVTHFSSPPSVRSDTQSVIRPRSLLLFLHVCSLKKTTHFARDMAVTMARRGAPSRRSNGATASSRAGTRGLAALVQEPSWPPHGRRAHQSPHVFEPKCFEVARASGLTQRTGDWIWFKRLRKSHPNPTKHAHQRHAPKHGSTLLENRVSRVESKSKDHF